MTDVHWISCALKSSLIRIRNSRRKENTFEIKNGSGTAYEHCELSVNGEGFLAIGEAKNLYDVCFLYVKESGNFGFVRIK